MEMNEIKKMNDEDLGLESARVRRALFNLKSQVVTEKIKDSSQFGKMRVELARLLTEESSRRVAKNPPVSRKKVAKAPVVKTSVLKNRAAKKPGAKRSDLKKLEAGKHAAEKKVMS